MNILFICRGNVGRSQMAEALFNKITSGKHKVSSTGTWVYDKVGESRDGELLKDRKGAAKVIDSLKEIGLDVSNSRRTQLTPELLDSAEKVIVMAEEYSIPDYLKSREDAIYWEVEDPKEMDLAGTNKIRDQIKDLVMEFSARL